MCYGAIMRTFAVVYPALMIALIVGLDVTLLKHHFGERLAVNVAIVFIFAGLYLRYLRGT